MHKKPTSLTDNAWRVKHSRLRKGEASKMQEDAMLHYMGFKLETEKYIAEI